MKTIYVVGTCDTKERELQYVKAAITETGMHALLVDVSTQGRSAAADIGPDEVARHHPGGRDAVLGLNDRGAAVTAMGEALVAWLGAQGDIGGLIGLGGGGNTAIVTQGMRALPIGVPKLMVSTVASGNVAPYVGPSDICMAPAITDVAGLNRINRVVLANAAHAIAGMARHPVSAAPAAERPVLGLTQFGVTTACVDQVRTALEGSFECMVFHATGIGGQTMEKLADSGFLSGVLDITTTEVADYLNGGVLPCTEDRFGAIQRSGLPCVLSVGALDMVNFGAMDSVPPHLKGRNFYQHNAQVTLMRTTPAENTRAGEWIAGKLNQCQGPVRVLIPEGGVSALDAPGMAFHDPAADRALFDALGKHLVVTPQRRLEHAPHHINDAAFARLLVAQFLELSA